MEGCSCGGVLHLGDLADVRHSCIYKDSFGNGLIHPPSHEPLT